MNTAALVSSWWVLLHLLRNFPSKSFPAEIVVSVKWHFFPRKISVLLIFSLIFLENIWMKFSVQTELNLFFLNHPNVSFGVTPALTSFRRSCCPKAAAWKAWDLRKLWASQAEEMIQDIIRTQCTRATFFNTSLWKLQGQILWQHAVTCFTKLGPCAALMLGSHPWMVNFNHCSLTAGWAQVFLQQGGLPSASHHLGCAARPWWTKAMKYLATKWQIKSAAVRKQREEISLANEQGRKGKS